MQTPFTNKVSLRLTAISTQERVFSFPVAMIVYAEWILRKKCSAYGAFKLLLRERSIWLE